MINEAGQVPDDQPTPNKSTGINVLEDLLKKIIPQLEIDYRMMTTADEQRESFRAHIVNAVINNRYARSLIEVARYCLDLKYA